MFEVQEPKKGALWVVKNGSAPSRLVRADRLRQVESFVLQDFEISKAKAEDAFELAKQGVVVEQVA